MLHLDSAVRFADILDGTTNTIAVGERPPSSDNFFGWWYAGVGQLDTGSGDMLVGTRELKAIPYKPSIYCGPGPCHFTDGGTPNDCDIYHFWSHHPGGANFLFCDGSVRYLTYAADPLLPALGTRAKGESIAAWDE